MQRSSGQSWHKQLVTGQIRAMGSICAVAWLCLPALDSGRVPKKRIIGGMMKLVRRVLLAGVLVSVLAGCTYSEPGHDQDTRPVEAASAFPSPSAVSATMQGSFQSLTAATSGTATLEVNESGAVLQLENMASEPGKDLRVMLSPGTLAAGVGGDLELSSTEMIEIGQFRDGATQRFVMEAQMWTAMQDPARSVLIYDYSAKNTRAVAVLSDQK